MGKKRRRAAGKLELERMVGRAGGGAKEIETPTLARGSLPNKGIGQVVTTS